MTNSRGDVEMGGTRSAGNTTGSGAGPVMMSSAPTSSVAGLSASQQASLDQANATVRTFEESLARVSRGNDFGAIQIAQSSLYRAIQNRDSLIARLPKA